MKKYVSVLLCVTILWLIQLLPNDINMGVIASAESAFDSPKYAYGEGSTWSYDGKIYRDINISWSEIAGAEQYNVYLYNFALKKYHRVYEVKEQLGGLNTSAHLSGDTVTNFTDYISENKFFFAVSAVKICNGKATESTLSNGYSGYITEAKEAVYVKHTDKTPIYDYTIIDITSQKKKLSKSESMKAVQTVKGSNDYKVGMVNNYGKDIIDKKYGSYFNTDGTIEPKAEYKYNVDLNGDGKKESFIVVSMPIEYASTPYHIIVFESNDGKMKVMDSFFSNGVAVKVYDYGKFKHFYYESMGGAGYQMHSSLFGMKKNKIKTYISGRIYPEKYKKYLKIPRPQFQGGMYYYNRSYDEYIGVTGNKVNINDVLKKDKTDSLKDLREAMSSGISYECYEWYDMYYIFTPSSHAGGSDVFKYNDGAFTSEPFSEEKDQPLPFQDYDTAKYYTYWVEQ